MDNQDTKKHLLQITALASGYCSLLEHAREFEKEDFIKEILGYLPRLYYAFSEFVPEDPDSVSLDFGFYRTYVDEDFYESVRRNVEVLLGPDDAFLETFEEDMKYSDTPIGASIAECLADIFQPLYNFISIVKESDGEQAAGAYAECRENFEAYWAQTLCNVMRALNHLRFGSSV
ncbi:MAG: DUF5063 domain-containing protein [Muribaculaceae bacterium]|nr:DUF5063 domain-containing protein [Muribaculaceae bacterium]